MRASLLCAFLLSISFSSSAQLTTSVSTEDVSCFGSNDGSYTLEAVLGCFPPITMVVDSDTSVFTSLINNGYDIINQGMSPDTAEANSVWAGNTNIGEVYVVSGYYRDSITFESTTLQAVGGRDVFVACYETASGSLLWANTSGGPGFEGLVDMIVHENAVYAVGFFQGTAYFQGDSLTSNGSLDSYIAKFDIATGALDTVVNIGGGSYDFASCIKAEGDELYVGGGYLGSITLGGSNLTSNGAADIYIVNLDTFFTQNWAATAGGSSIDLISDIDVQNGRTYVTGAFYGSTFFGSTGLNSTGQSDAYVSALSSSGSWLWALAGGGGGNNAYDQGFGITSTSQGDTLYVGGYYANSIDFGTVSATSNGGYDGFILKVDSSGTDHGIMTIGGSGTDAVYDLDMIANQLIGFAGQMEGSVTFGDSTFTSNGDLDAFMGKITSSFEEIWAKNLGGSEQDSYNAIDKGEGDRLHSAGFIQDDVSSYQNGLISAGERDVIVTNGTFFGMADTTITMTGLAAGEYYVFLQDNQGNTEIDTITIGSPDSISLSGVVTDASSGTAADGSIDLTVTGGTPGYTFTWSNAASTEDITLLTTGTYCVTVTDSNGCIDTACFFVDSTSTVGPFTVMSTVTDVQCGGDSTGSIDLSVSGGVAPYTFNWSNGAITEDLNGIMTGTYYVTVSDNDTSSYIDSFFVDEPAPLVVAGSITSPSSGAALDGAVDVTVSGGTPGYAYAWSNGPTTEDISGIGIGLYTITVTDSAGCSSVQTFDVDTVALLSLVLSSSDVTCINSLNGAIDLTVVGGLPPFSYVWSNGMTTEDISGLAAGTYTVTVTDSLSQVAIGEDSIDANPIHPDPTVGPIIGPASVQAWTNYNYSVPSSNGSGFTWSATGGTLVSSVSNAAVIQWNAGPNGVVTVAETDANGCTASDSLGVVILFVGIDGAHENAILLYPNPTQDILNVQLPSLMLGANIQLWNSQGQLVLSDRELRETNAISVQGFPRGNYILRLEQGVHQVQHKIILE